MGVARLVVPPEAGPAGDSAGDSAADAAGDSATDALRCPAGMAGVPGDDPAWCIDAYEVSFTEGVLGSTAGAWPAEGITWEDAHLWCAERRLVGADGVDHGPLRLATFAEWRDAGDGVVGDGGTPYPWGEEWDATRCAIVGDDGVPTLTGPAPTGSYPDCVSPFGVYDQIGNLWEWVDAGLHADVAAWEAERAAEGVAVRLDADGVWVTGPVPPWTLGIIGLPTSTLRLDDAGRLHVQLDGATGFPDGVARGWLWADPPEAPGAALPVVLRIEADTGWVVPEPDRDGSPIPGKVGGAWYSGAKPTLQAATYDHTPDFGGSIGFRCVGAP